MAEPTDKELAEAGYTRAEYEEIRGERGKSFGEIADPSMGAGEESYDPHYYDFMPGYATEMDYMNAMEADDYLHEFDDIQEDFDA